MNKITTMYFQIPSICCFTLVVVYMINKCGRQDFLKDRKFRVRVNASYSTWDDVTSGLPQGSVLEGRTPYLQSV